MIPADDRAPLPAGRSVGAQQSRGVDLEAALRLGGDIGCRLGIVDRGVAVQDAARLVRGIGPGMLDDRRQRGACNRDLHPDIG
jgi:hypothetical protein